MRVIAEDRELRELAREAETATRLAVDLEASGMFTYRARICTVQLAWGGGQHVAIVDALKVSVEGLGHLLGERGPVKVVHDVAFDARLLAEAGIELGNVHDTALAAQMLGRAATGLASLLGSELGVPIGKELQQHDWRVRPLDARMLSYLAADVAHLEALEHVLWHEVVERGVEDAVLEETRYRLASAIAASRSPPAGPAYARIKGVAGLPERERAVLRVIAELREREAERRDVPPYKVASSETLLALARARPRTAAEVARMRGVSTSTPAARAFIAELARGIADAGETIPDDDRSLFERPHVAAEAARARRQREVRLTAWRRTEAKRREVDEQVVLPGHCVKDAVDDAVTDLDALARVPGIGAFRVSRDGEAILRAMRGEEVVGEDTT
jgi:ribonuclease D